MLGVLLFVLGGYVFVVLLLRFPSSLLLVVLCVLFGLLLFVLCCLVGCVLCVVVCLLLLCVLMGGLVCFVAAFFDAWLLVLDCC